MSKSKELDQFYTREDIAQNCLEVLFSAVPDVLLPGTCFVEPAAGTGAFFLNFPDDHKRYGGDIDPKCPCVEQANFLTDSLRLPKAKAYVVVSNPPFGNKASLAVAFFNRAAEFAEVQALIVPVQFRKWSVQKDLTPGWFG